MAIVDAPRTEVLSAVREPWLGKTVVAILGVVFVIGSTIWTLRFLAMLRDAAPVLDMFRAEHGPGKMTFDDWRASGAGEIFCPHPNGDPSTNRIGRYIDANWAYGPLLAMGTFASVGAAAILGLLNNAIGGWQKLLGRSIVFTVVVPIVIIAVYSGDIAALTDITE